MSAKIKAQKSKDRQIAELSQWTWPEVEKYLERDHRLIIPIGSTEQHGPTGLIGTDYLTAQAIALAAAEKTKTLVAPPLCYGMALHHMDFPGSAALKPSVYLQVICEIIWSFAQHGFQKFYFVNGHGGNIPTVQAAFSEALHHYPRLSLKLFNWWVLEEVVAYENEYFGEDNGFHATCGEISVTQHTHPEAFQVKRDFRYFKTTDKSDWPLSPERFRETFPDGRMSSDPRKASATHGDKIFQIAVRSIAEKINFDSPSIARKNRRQ
jgi:creatinine amidohydrolase